MAMAFLSLNPAIPEPGEWKVPAAVSSRDGSPRLSQLNTGDRERHLG